MKKTVKKILIAILGILLAFLVYAVPYYHAQDLPKQEETMVQITEQDNTICYDGPGTDMALIFYPGAKVDEAAYGWMMEQLAKDGIDCYLVKMPLHLAILGKDKAYGIIKTNPGYEHWVLGGHSLGGAMAADFAGNHTVDGLVLLAAYSTEKLPADLSVLSIYGSEDGVLKRDNYAKYRSNLPVDFTEVVIDGGNHGNFGYYGEQKGDKKAAITREEQQKRTVKEIEKKFLGQ